MKPFPCVIPVLVLGLSAAFIPQLARTQPKIPEEMYVFDRDWKPAIIERGKYVISVRKFGDSVYKWDTYHLKGPIMRTETFSDHNGKRLNGDAYYYTEKGVLDSIAHFKNGLRDGAFYRIGNRGDTLVWLTEYVYKNDELISTGPVNDEMNEPDPASSTKAMYPGGLKKWYAFLSDNMVYSRRAINFQIDGAAWMRFSVDEKGKLADISLVRSVEYSIDREVERVIRKSGNWIPATKNGLAVKSWKIQRVAMIRHGDPASYL